MVATLTAVPAPPPTANDRLKASFTSTVWTSLIAAVVLHFAIFAFWPELTATSVAIDRTEITGVELPPDVKIPEAPAALTRPARPVIADADVSEDLTIAPTTFLDNPVETLPPPPPGQAEGDLGTAPRFVPFTLAPQVLNVEAVLTALRHEYPPLLRDAGIGGMVRVYFLVGEDGTVRDTRIDQPSEYQALDAAALKVAGVYEFSPAQNRDTKVAVWVSIPITFRVR